MNLSHRRQTPDLAATWARFKAVRGGELENWVEAERALAAVRSAGGRDIEPGDRLLIAEAALQSAIMDFAASEDPGSDPTPTAVGLLRLAEQVLETGAPRGAALRGAEKRLNQRRSGRDRRRPDRPGS